MIYKTYAMQIYSAFDYDKIQVAELLTAETIHGYFRGMHHVALVNMAYSANQIIFDIAGHFVRETRKPVPSLFQKTLPKEPEDPTMRDFRPSANFIKHADRDWMAYKSITPLDLVGYINALCYDYRELRNAMLREGYIATHPESQKHIEGLEGKTRVGLLTEIFGIYMIGVMFGQSGYLSIEGEKIFPWLYDRTTGEDHKRTQMLNFIEDNGITIQSSGGLPDHYLTKVARPFIDPSTGTMPPKPHAG